MRYARTLKIVDHDGTGFTYENVSYTEDSAGLTIHWVTRWNMVDIERMEVDCGSHTEAPNHIVDRDGDATLGTISGASVAGPYRGYYRRPIVKPLDDDTGSSDGC